MIEGDQKVYRYLWTIRRLLKSRHVVQEAREGLRKILGSVRGPLGSASDPSVFRSGSALGPLYSTGIPFMSRFGRLVIHRGLLKV